MKMIVVTLFALVAVASAVDPTVTPIPIISQTQDILPDGSFSSSYETGNGISEQVQGTIKKDDHGEDIEVVQGSVSWTAPDGTPFKFTYVADENGYQPQADFLPTPPPVPLPIQRALDWEAAHPEPTTNIPAQ